MGRHLPFASLQYIKFLMASFHLCLSASSSCPFNFALQNFPYHTRETCYIYDLIIWVLASWRWWKGNHVYQWHLVIACSLVMWSKYEMFSNLQEHLISKALIPFSEFCSPCNQGADQLDCWREPDVLLLPYHLKFCQAATILVILYRLSGLEQLSDTVDFRYFDFAYLERTANLIVKMWYLFKHENLIKSRD